MNRLLLFVLLTAALSAQPAEVVRRLRQGGCILYFRHMNTDKSHTDTDVAHPTNYSAQRQLSDLGRRQARAVGARLKELGVPVSAVYTTMYMRGRESAELMELGPVHDLMCLSSLYQLDATEVARRTEDLKRFLATPPPPGTNLVVVSHGPNLESALGDGTPELPEGGAAVIVPENGSFRILSVLKIEQWGEPTTVLK